MSEPSEPVFKQIDAQPEAIDMSLRADAGVHWTNPDSLTREQTIRISGINGALAILNSQYAPGGMTVDGVIREAERIAAYIATGERPDTPEATP